MNFELLSKLAIEENEKLKTEISLFRTRNSVLHNEVEKLQTTIKDLKEENLSLKDEINSLKNLLEFKTENNKNENSYYGNIKLSV